MRQCYQDWVLHLVKVGSSKTSLDGEPAMKLYSDLENEVEVEPLQDASFKT